MSLMNDGGSIELGQLQTVAGMRDILTLPEVRVDGLRIGVPLDTGRPGFPLEVALGFHFDCALDADGGPRTTFHQPALDGLLRVYAKTWQTPPTIAVAEIDVDPTNARIQFTIPSAARNAGRQAVQQTFTYGPKKVKVPKQRLRKTMLSREASPKSASIVDNPFWVPHEDQDEGRFISGETTARKALARRRATTHGSF